MTLAADFLAGLMSPNKSSSSRLTVVFCLVAFAALGFILNISSSSSSDMLKGSDFLLFIGGGDSLVISSKGGGDSLMISSKGGGDSLSTFSMEGFWDTNGSGSSGGGDSLKRSSFNEDEGCLSGGEEGFKGLSLGVVGVPGRLIGAENKSSSSSLKGSAVFLVEGDFVNGSASSSLGGDWLSNRDVGLLLAGLEVTKLSPDKSTDSLGGLLVVGAVVVAGGSEAGRPGAEAPDAPRACRDGGRRFCCILARVCKKTKSISFCHNRDKICIEPRTFS